MKLIPPDISPGPWASAPVMHNQACGFRVHTLASAPYGMAHVYSPGDSAQANARAIAATPDTLAVLAAILRAAESPPGAVMGEARLCQQFKDQARAALIKAGYIIEE